MDNRRYLTDQYVTLLLLKTHIAQAPDSKCECAAAPSSRQLHSMPKATHQYMGHINKANNEPPLPTVNTAFIVYILVEHKRDTLF